MMNFSTTFSAGRVWAWWFAILLISVSIQCLTLTISPPVWYDEVMIVDYGRLALFEPHSDWSIYLTDAGRPTMYICYLACGLQEAACRMTGLTEVGPRLATMLGAVFAGTCLLGWFLIRNIKPAVALAGAGLLLLDPVFAQSYRGARVECWVFGFIFLACWLLWLAGAAARSGRRHGCWLTAAAGGCVAVAGLCWVSALLLVPLVLHEFGCAHQTRIPNGKWGSLPIQLLILTGAALGSFLLLLLPVKSIVVSAFLDLHGLMVPTSGKSNMTASLLQFAGSYQKSPWLLVAGLASIWLTANRWLAVAFFTAFLGVCATSTYIYRSMYLIPYLLLGYCLALDLVLRAPPARRGHQAIMLATLAICIGWSVSLTLGLRTWTAWRHREERRPKLIEELARASIGKQSANVYISPREFYYAGRQLGWRLFHVREDNLAGPVEMRTLSELVPRMKYVILRTDHGIDPLFQNLLGQDGFKPWRRMQAGSGTPQIEKTKAEFGDYVVFVSDRPEMAGNPVPAARTSAKAIDIK